MIDLLKLVVGFTAMLVLALFGVSAEAAIPATQTNTSSCTVAPCVESRYSVFGFHGGYFIALPAACTSSAAAVNASSYYLTTTNPRVVNQRCYVDAALRSNGTPQGTFDYAVSNRQTVPPATPTYSCPANSTLSGTQCTCNAPAWVEQGSVCISVQQSNNQSCKALADGLNLVGAPLVHFGSAGLTACFGGFVVSGTGAASGGGQTELYGPFKCSGADASACSVVPKPSDITASCAAGSYPGTVNGVQVCVPPTSSVEAPKTTTTTTPAGGTAPPIAGAPPGTTTEEKQTECQGPSCTTTTYYKDSAGAPTGTKTETSSKANYCAENPKAPGCSSLEASTFSGSCGSFNFKGDAIQGSIAKEIHTQNCLMNATTPEAAKYDTAKTKTGDQTTTLPGNTTVTIGVSSFDTSDSIGGKQCIGNVTGTVLGVSITLPFGDYVCPQAQNLRLILLSLGFIIGYVIIARRS